MRFIQKDRKGKKAESRRTADKRQRDGSRAGRNTRVIRSSVRRDVSVLGEDALQSHCSACDRKLVAAVQGGVRSSATGINEGEEIVLYRPIQEKQSAQ